MSRSERGGIVQEAGSDIALPIRDTDVFTILTYAKKDTEVPKEWIDSDPHMILGNAEQVRRRFSCPSHQVDRRAIQTASS